MITILFYAAVILFALIVAYTDTTEERIPNKVTVPTAISGIIFHTIVWIWAYNQDPAVFTDHPVLQHIAQIGPGWSLAGFFFGFFLLLIPALIGGIGMGDVKYLAALGAWLGITGVFMAFALAMCYASVASIFIMLRQGVHKSVRQMRKAARQAKQEGTSPLDSRGRPKKRKTLPFGIPGALGVCTLLAWLAAYGNFFLDK